jgi:fluoroquinolone resistance protein
VSTENDAPARIDPFAAEELFQGATFVDLDLAGGRVARKEFDACTFRACKLATTTWERCVFERSVFEDCDLTRAVLSSTSLRGARFVRCKLLGVDFSKIAEHPDVSFSSCSLRYAAFHDVNLRGTSFTSCELQEAQLTGCSLIEADFAGSDLTDASISRCDLAGADFSEAHGVYFEPRQNAAKDAYVSVETAVMQAQRMGLRVAGYDAARARKRKR